VRREETVVLGAGFAGLGTAAMLRKRGVPTVILERSDRVGESWRNRYDSLRLNTLRWMSTPPGYRIPRRYGRWPTRDQLVQYAEEYLRRMELEVRFGTAAQRIDRANGGWRVETSAGPLEARWVVVATGSDHDPKLPECSGIETFAGELIHAAEYRRPDAFRGKDVLVISAGNTGSEVAYELVQNGAARVRTAMRTPPNIFPREWHGIPLALTVRHADGLPLRVNDRLGHLMQRMIYGDLAKYGLPKPPIGFATNVKVRHVAPMIDAGFVEAVKQGQIEILPAVTAFEGPDVILADGSRIQPEAVIAATGYRRGLESLVGHLGVVDDDGFPTVNGAPGDPRTPGLYFNGYYPALWSQLGPMRIEARKIARAIARDLHARRGTTPGSAKAPAAASA
jgi:putative flavoprotein involved in K+ transport